MPAKDFASTRYSGSGADQRRQRRRLAPGVDVLYRRAGGPSGSATRGEQHHVRGDAVAERALCLRPDQGRLSAEVEIPAGREPERHRHRLLRRHQSRRVLRRRQDRLQPAGRTHRRGGCGDRPRALEDEDCRSRRRRDDADGTVRGEGSRHRRRLRRRVRHLRVAQGPRPRRPARSSGPRATSARMRTCS